MLEGAILVAVQIHLTLTLSITGKSIAMETSFNRLNIEISSFGSYPWVAWQGLTTPRRMMFVSTGMTQALLPELRGQD